MGMASVGVTRGMLSEPVVVGFTLFSASGGIVLVLREGVNVPELGSSRRYGLSLVGGDFNTLSMVIRGNCDPFLYMYLPL